MHYNMFSKLSVSLALVGAMFLSVPTNAQDHDHHEDSHAEEAHETHDHATEEGHDVKAQIKETIEHHLSDSYDFTITEGVSFPLPVILFDEGLKVFSSSKFHHGESVAEVNGNYYVLHHSKVYKTDASGHLTMDEHHHPTNAMPLDFSITKNVFMILVMAIFMFFLFKGAAKAYQTGQTPKKAGRFLEPLIINVTGNITITFSLALITFLITQVSGNKHYWMHIFWMPGVPVVLKPVMAII